MSAGSSFLSCLRIFFGLAASNTVLPSVSYASCRSPTNAVPSTTATPLPAAAATAAAADEADVDSTPVDGSRAKPYV